MQTPERRDDRSLRAVPRPGHAVECDSQFVDADDARRPCSCGRTPTPRPSAPTPSAAGRAFPIAPAERRCVHGVLTLHPCAVCRAEGGTGDAHAVDAISFATREHLTSEDPHKWDGFTVGDAAQMAAECFAAYDALRAAINTPPSAPQPATLPGGDSALAQQFAAEARVRAALPGWLVQGVAGEQGAALLRDVDASRTPAAPASEAGAAGDEALEEMAGAIGRMVLRYNEAQREQQRGPAVNVYMDDLDAKWLREAERLVTAAPAHPAPAPDDAAALRYTLEQVMAVLGYDADDADPVAFAQARMDEMREYDTALAAARAREGDREAVKEPVEVKWAWYSLTRESAYLPTLADKLALGEAVGSHWLDYLRKMAGWIDQVCEARAALRPARDDSTEVG